MAFLGACRGCACASPPHLLFAVQVLQARIEAWLGAFGAELAAMNEATVADTAKSLAAVWLERPRALSAEHDIAAGEMLSQR